MRPLRLKLKGFTAFRDEQEVDFTDLDLFAITGPTGAGKSSLLDAITYALYGEVERVNRECAQLVSHGHPRLVVSLDFQVGHEQYRISRSTPAVALKGPTKVVLERLQNGDYESYGEGADRVRECREIVERLVGLDYTAFTRSVLLPQGKFAEFMLGDANKRREILTELLGLSLFKRMAQRAGQLARDAAYEAKGKRDVLETEYSGVDKQAVAEARLRRRDAARREKDLLAVRPAVNVIAQRWAEAQRAASDLSDCAREAREYGSRVLQVAQGLEKLDDQLKQAQDANKEKIVVADKLEQAVRRARGELQQAEKKWGSAVELAGALQRARSLFDLRAQLRECQSSLEEAEKKRPQNQAAVRESQKALQVAVDAAERAEVELKQTRLAQQNVEHANLVAAVSCGLKEGDSCPVCGARLETAPSPPAASALEEARLQARRAETERDGAQHKVKACERDLERAKRDLEENVREIGRLGEELKKRSASLEAAKGELVTALRGDVPEDALVLLGERMERLRQLSDAVISSERQAEDALSGRDDAAQRLRDVLAAVERGRDRLSQRPAALFARIKRAAVEETSLPNLESMPTDDAPLDVLISFAFCESRAFDNLANQLENLSNERAQSEVRLLEEAHQMLAQLVPQATSLSELVETLAEASRRAAAEAAMAAREFEALKARLETRLKLEGEVSCLLKRANRFNALAGDLRADRLIAFLQNEALQALAEAGARHLERLSDGRYRLGCENDFYVIDTWNGDEERSVRTLSGGETFLASLSLALALSEQVRSLSLTERARLDSLFLDEGFGTLDEDSLRVVVDAIEQLGGDGRLVGVITHVRELAEQFPRIEVEKSPRGSQVRLVSA